MRCCSHHTKVIVSAIFFPGILLLLYILFFGGISEYQHRINQISTAFQTNTWFSTDENYVQFNPTLADQYGNKARDVCTHPYEFACEIDEPHYPEIFYEHNIKMVEDILSSKRLQSNIFFQKCSQFHQKSPEDKLRELFKNAQMQKITSAIREINDTHSLIDTIGRLHLYGIRSPFHLNLLTSGTYQLSRMGFVLYSELHRAMEMYQPNFSYSEIEYIIDRALQLDQAIGTNMYDYVWTDLHTFGDSFHFPLEIWFPSPVPRYAWISKKTMIHFHQLLTEIPLIDWKNYLNVVSISWILRQTRTEHAVTEHVCRNQFQEYFPLAVCRSLRSKVGHQETLDDLKNMMINGFRKKVIQENIFEFSPRLLMIISGEINRLDVYMNRCTLKSFNETLTQFENKILSRSDYDSYLDLIFSMIGDPIFQERRNDDYDIYYRHLVDTYIQWNAWFDSTVHSIVIPPGILLLPSGKMKHGSYQYYLSLKSPVFHEKFHFLSSILRVYLHEWSFKYKNFHNQLRIRYGYPPDDVHEENMADNFGLWAAFHIWNETTHPTISQQRGFLLSYVRLHCRSSDVAYIETDHASPYKRAVLSLKIVEDVFNTVFNCTSSSLSSRLL
jgi:hypothetical protein